MQLQESIKATINNYISIEYLEKSKKWKRKPKIYCIIYTVHDRLLCLMVFPLEGFKVKGLPES